MLIYNLIKMKITLKNFGGFIDHQQELASTTAANGYGKTTLLNGYIFAVSGRTQTGFEPRNSQADPAELTEVCVYGFAGMPKIRRTFHPVAGVTLYVGDAVCTQTDFVTALSQSGISVGLALACADPNVLTDPNLSSEDLRKVLTNVGIIDNNKAKELRKELANERKALKIAEQNALSNVSVPVRTVDRLSESEIVYLNRYHQCQCIEAKGEPSKTCGHCGAPLEESMYVREREEYYDALAVLAKDGDEAKRILEKQNAYHAETVKIDDATRLVKIAMKARAEVLCTKKLIETLEESIRAEDEKAIRIDLPMGWGLITEQTTKTGVVKSVCALTYGTTPLRSVNRAKRVRLCVELLHRARERAGMVSTVPIVVDNAESLDTLYGLPDNVITLGVARR